MATRGKRMLQLLCLLSSMLVSVYATQASERESESVEVTFYQLSTTQWSNSISSFKTLVAAEASSYCANNAATCGLTSGFVFTTFEIGVYSGPTEESKSTKISFYIDFPTVHVVDPSSTTTYVVNSAAVETILANITDSLEAAVGTDITYIGDEFYSIDPDATANKVLIPIAFIILLAIIILAIALHMWNKRKEEAEKKKQRAMDREKRKKTARISPAYTVENDAKQLGNNWLRKSRKKKTVKQDHGTNGLVATLSMKTNMVTYNSNPAKPPHYEDPVSVDTTGLPPLPNPASEDEKDEKKREKKERRRRKREKRRHQKEEEEEDESEKSKTESLEKTGNVVPNANVIPVEDEHSLPEKEDQESRN